MILFSTEVSTLSDLLLSSDLRLSLVESSNDLFLMTFVSCVCNKFVLDVTGLKPEVVVTVELEELTLKLLVWKTRLFEVIGETKT
jgi:hypothetical protein